MFRSFLGVRTVVPTTNSAYTMSQDGAANAAQSGSTMNTEEFNAHVEETIAKKGYVSQEQVEELVAKALAEAAAERREKENAGEDERKAGDDASSMSTDSNKGNKSNKGTYVKALGSSLFKDAKLAAPPTFTGTGPTNTAANNLTFWEAMLRLRAKSLGLDEEDGLLALALQCLGDGPAVLCQQYQNEYSNFDELIQFLNSSTFGETATMYNTCKPFFDGSLNIFSPSKFALILTKMERFRARMPIKAADAVFIQFVLQNIRHEQLLSAVMTAPDSGEWTEFVSFRGFALQKAAALSSSGASSSRPNGSSGGQGKSRHERGRQGPGPSNGDKRGRSQSRGSSRGPDRDAANAKARKCSGCKSTDHAVHDFKDGKPVCPNFNWRKYNSSKRGMTTGAGARETK